jgi:hypothetical protein
MSTPKRFELVPTNGFDTQSLERFESNALTTRPERHNKSVNLGIVNELYPSRHVTVSSGEGLEMRCVEMVGHGD